MVTMKLKLLQKSAIYQHPFQDISKIGRMHLTSLKTEMINSQLTSRAVTDQQLNDEKLDPWSIYGHVEAYSINMGVSIS